MDPVPFAVSVTLPFDQIDHPDEFISGDAVREIAQAADQAGFYAGAVTDHPVPGYRWLDNGGHYAQDPFVLLSMIAAVTTNLRLMTGILVLPYRNPFITARAVSSLDVFSGGRVDLGIGAGYLKPEYKALGVDFDTRNDLMDEYIRAMRAAWTGEDFAFEGSGYTAVGNRMLPMPAQKPHPRLLIGGNSKRAIRRAAELGDAWHPFFVPKSVAETARTTTITDEADLRAGMTYMVEHCEKIGRNVPPAVISCGLVTIAAGWNSQQALDTIGSFTKLGLTGGTASMVAQSRSQWCDQARKFGEEVLRKIDLP
jgi:probable F420-dependent oxidoreductase